MGNIISHFTRRGMQLHTILRKSETLVIEISLWAAALSAVLSMLKVVPMILSCMVDYTLCEVVEALAIIESRSSPTSIPLQSLAAHDLEEDTINKKPRQQPITTSFRTTIRHLHTHAGRLSPFRGFSLACVRAVLHGALSALFRLLFIRYGLNEILASICLADLQMTWTHIAISKPSKKFWFEHLSTLPRRGRNWRQIAIPTAVFACAEWITIGLLTIYSDRIIDKLDADALSNMMDHDGSSLVLVCVAILVLVMSVVVYLPAKVILIRVYASLLPDTMEAIVPFDRTFGRRVSPSGADAIGMAEAWRTFGRHSKLNLLMVHFKIIAIQLLLKFAVVMLRIIDLKFVLGVELSKTSFVSMFN